MKRLGLNFFTKFYLFLVVCSCFGQEQTSSLKSGVTGFWYQNSKEKDKDFKWDAKWIWLPEEVNKDVMLARRSFELTENPRKALLRITASSKYELFINGNPICQGPARSAAHHQSYDILEIKSQLKLGKNTIAVKVHHQKEEVSYHLKSEGGLLVQLEIIDEKNLKLVVKSDKDWNVSFDPSWNDKVSYINRFQLAVNDNVDLNFKIENFEAINFDDTCWKKGRELSRNSGWPAPQKNESPTATITPWTSLVPRDIPYLKEVNIAAPKLIEVKEIPIADLNYSVLLNGEINKNIFKNFIKNDPLVVPKSSADKAWFLLFDFGKVINGMANLSIKGTKKTIVNVLSAPYILDKNFTHNIVNSNFNDQLILSGKMDSWQALYMKPTRYLAILIKGNLEDVKIYSSGIHQLEYPFENQSKLDLPEAPWLENYWNASINTLNVCTTDAFTDNYREKRQYAQTGYYASLGNYWTFGDFALQRRCLVQIAQEQEANGIMPAYAPLAGNDFMIILDSNCLWIRSLHNYLLYSGDFKTVKELLPAAKKLMELLDSFTNTLGMIDSPPYSYWLDHAVNDRRGSNLCLNGHYLGALTDFAEVLLWLNDEESEQYRQKAELLRNSIRTYLWDEDKQLFADAYINGKRSELFSEHANAMALACKIASPLQAQAIINKLIINDTNDYVKRENGITMVSPAMTYFLCKGLAEYGYEKESLILLDKRFSKMLNTNGDGTLWEEWWLDGTGRSGKLQTGKTRSDAQTESAFTPALIAEYILGINPILPGMKELVIKKPNTSLTIIKASVPSPEGIFSIEWKLSANKELNLVIPGNMIVKIDSESFGESLGSNIVINGKPYSPDFNDTKFILLKKGIFKITF